MIMSLKMRDISWLMELDSLLASISVMVNKSVNKSQLSKIDVANWVGHLKLMHEILWIIKYCLGTFDRIPLKLICLLFSHYCNKI